MHELSVMSNILRTILDHAHRNQVSRIVAVNLRVSQLTDLLDEWMQKYFDHLSKGTLAEGALLKIERSPLVFTCRDCNQDFTIDKSDWGNAACTGCGGANLRLTAGREFFIENMEVI